MSPHEAEEVFTGVQEVSEPLTKTRTTQKYRVRVILKFVLVYILTLYAILFKLHHMKFLTLVYCKD